MRIKLFFCLLCIVMAGACSSKDKGESAEAPFKAASLGITLNIPKGFEPLSPEQLEEAGTAGLTLAPVEPFTVRPLYGFRDSSGKGLLIVSELQFMEPDKADTYPMDNLYRYQKNLEAFFNAGEEISSEEQNSGDISLILLGMVFDEGGNDISLFKGLCYKYPEQFFMIDLYAINAHTTPEDALAYQNMFYSMGLL